MAVKPIRITCEIQNPVRHRPAPARGIVGYDTIPGFADYVLGRANVLPDDVIMIGSVSGYQYFPVDLALKANEMGCATVAVTSVEYSGHLTGKHPSGKRLFEACTYCLDNCTNYGDTLVDVPALEQRLQDAIGFQPLVEMVAQPVPAPLTMVCEGRASRTRAEWGVEFDLVPYAQDAIATRLDCERPHGAVARQWFGADGSILAFLPLGGDDGNSVAVVWSVAHGQSQHWLQADGVELAGALREASRGALGALAVIAPRAAWLLVQARARRWCGTVAGAPGQAWVLAGDAAHAVHPLAGQGLNLGLADVAALVRVLSQREGWRALADQRLLRRYERARKTEVATAMLAMDGLQQLFTRGDAALQPLRRHGMNVFDRLVPLKGWVSRHAMGVA